MIPEIALLDRHFSGQKWNNSNQRAFMEILKEEDFFNGKGENDPAFSARDRINRAPQILGFVVLRPKIQLTPAGKALTTARRTEEIFLRQLLKFQIPSPYHIQSDKAATFRVKPYLEIFRLIRHLGTLRFDELKMFALQLTDYHNFDDIVRKIEVFRSAMANRQGSYKNFAGEYFASELREIYAEELAKGLTATRETDDASTERFLQTKARNMRDYADACFRYLRATGLVNISHTGKSLSIAPDRVSDVDFFLDNTDREPCFVDDCERYVEYLGNPRFPLLLIDDRERLLEKIHTSFPLATIDENVDTETLKSVFAELSDKRKANVLSEEVEKIKNFRHYDEIQGVFEQILSNVLYDAPLMLEWNTWRAMTMLNGGIIKANLQFDDHGQPVSTAQGNMADIVCDYGDFGVSVEVTMATGQRQYEMEGEPVARHLGRLKRETGKPFYCLFIAPTINEACIAHFYTLHKENINYYGGKSTIIPLSVNVFKKMIEDARKADYIPRPEHVRRLFDYSNAIAQTCDNEETWYRHVKDKALNWLME
ncbi:MAG: AlwI family type II restriction endonuclease [Prevotellaceae bacterium]|nr:AlwI family type II restriction endonuclease [Prevotellaceae bacterium]